MTKQHNASDAKSQLDKFKEAARDLACDDDEKKFNERLTRLVQKKTLEGD